MEKFNTFEEAEKHLEIRKKKAYIDIEKRGDKVLSDNSFVVKDLIEEGKFVPLLMIMTQNMYDDLHNLKPFNYEGILEILSK